MRCNTTPPLQKLKAQELAKRHNIETYIRDRRSTYVHPDRETLDGFTMRGRLDWAAVNAHVRIAAAEILLEALKAFRRGAPRTAPRVSSVVVSSEYWVRNLHDAHAIDVREIGAELAWLFRGQNYVGMIEPGFYPRRSPSGTVGKGVVSWHAHLLFWGTERETLRQALEGYSKRVNGPLFGVPAANLRWRSWKSAEACVCYMLKTPAKSYSTQRVPEMVNPTTGEIIPEHDRQIAQALRPGEHLRMRNVLREFCLDDLLLVGGTGNILIQPLWQAMLGDRDRGRRASPRAQTYYRANREPSWGASASS